MTRKAEFQPRGGVETGTVEVGNGASPDRLALLTIFEARGPLGIINVHQDFFHTFVAEGGNMEEHIQKLRSLQKQLHALGDLIKDCNFCNVLLTSLPGSWSTFLTAINASLPTLSSDVLITRVLEEDQTC